MAGEGTPAKLFDRQTRSVFNTLYKDHIEFASSKIESREIPSSKDGEKTILRRYPFGAVGIFPPYNAAIGLGSMAIISCYWAGNATVTRTPSKMPLTNMELAYVLTEAMKELEFPHSAFQSIIGPARSIAQYIVNESPLNAMVYYGDSDVGLELMSQAIRRGLHFIPVLAGSGVSLVWKDVDIEKVADYVNHARFFGSGQICLAAKKLFLHEAIYDDFLEGFDRKEPEIECRSSCGFQDRSSCNWSSCSLPEYRYASIIIVNVHTSELAFPQPVHMALPKDGNHISS